MLSWYGFGFAEKNDDNAGYYASSNSPEGLSELFIAPYFFLFGGFMDTGGNTVWVIGSEGKIWGASTSNAYHTQYAGYSKNVFTPTVIWWQGQGLSLRRLKTPKITPISPSYIINYHFVNTKAATVAGFLLGPFLNSCWRKICIFSRIRM